MLNKDSILKLLAVSGSAKAIFETFHYENEKWDEEAYLLKAPISKATDIFSADAISFLAEKGYLVESFKISYVKAGIFTVATAENLTTLLRPIRTVLDQETLKDLNEIKIGTYISNDWNDIMVYFETQEKMYLYAWETSA